MPAARPGSRAAPCRGVSRRRARRRTRRRTSWRWARSGVGLPSRRQCTGTARLTGRAASLLRGLSFQPVLEPAIEISIDRQVVAEELRIDFHDFRQPLVFLPAVDAESGDDQRERRQQYARPSFPTAARPAVAVAEGVVGPGEHRRRLGALTRKRELARRAKLLRGGGVDVQPLVENLPDTAFELRFVYGFFRTSLIGELRAPSLQLPKHSSPRGRSVLTRLPGNPRIRPRLR